MSGYAVSGFDVVAYRSLPDEPATPRSLAVAGKAEFTAPYNGAIFAFSTAQNLAQFKTNPERYAPQYDGHCAMGVAVGAKIPANPHLWRIVDDRLFLNINGNVFKMWVRDIPAHIAKGDENWRDLNDLPASRSSGAPGLVAALPPLDWSGS